MVKKMHRDDILLDILSESPLSVKEITDKYKKEKDTANPQTIDEGLLKLLKDKKIYLIKYDFALDEELRPGKRKQGFLREAYVFGSTKKSFLYLRALLNKILDLDFNISYKKLGDTYKELLAIFRIKLDKIRENMLKKVIIRSPSDEELAWFDKCTMYNFIESSVTNEELKENLADMENEIPKLREKYSNHEIWKYGRNDDLFLYEKGQMDHGTILGYNNERLPPEDEKIDELFDHILSYILSKGGDEYNILKENFIRGLSDIEDSERLLQRIIFDVELYWMKSEEAFQQKSLEEAERKLNNLYMGSK